MSNFDAFAPIIRVKNQVDPSNNHKKTIDFLMQCPSEMNGHGHAFGHEFTKDEKALRI